MAGGRSGVREKSDNIGGMVEWQSEQVSGTLE
jgi:hypothetical protein